MSAVHTGGGTRPRVASDRRPLMGGHATISVVGATSAVVDRGFELADRCEGLWSRFLPHSDISRLNWAEGRPVDVDPLTVVLIGAMRDAATLTEGDFDPTLLPQLIASGYAASTVAPELVTTLPATARAPGNLRLVEIDGSIVRMPLGTTLDPGGIGKGLAADLVCQLAIAAGAWGVMAELGGDICVAGEAPDGLAWVLGVEDPIDTSRHLTTVRLARGAIVTSSQRKRRFTTAEGERHHLIDPAAGSSAATSIQTATVIAAAGARAEALAKSAFMRDPESFLAWVPHVGGAALLIDDSGAQFTSTNWDSYA